MTSLLISLRLTYFHLLGNPISDVAFTNVLVVVDVGVMSEWLEAVLAKLVGSSVNVRLLVSADHSFESHQPVKL